MKKIHEEKEPWNSIRGQRRRCNCHKSRDYKYYGARGVRVLYTTREFITWWRTEQKKYPPGTRLTVDRLDTTKNYCFENIRLVPWAVNVAESNARTHIRAVEQVDLEGNVIAQFKSLKEAAQITGCSMPYVWRTANEGYADSGRFTKRKYSFFFRYI